VQTLQQSRHKLSSDNTLLLLLLLLLLSLFAAQELSDQTDRVIGLQQSRDQEKDAYDQQLQSLKTDFQEMKDKLTSDNMILCEQSVVGKRNLTYAA
jgi:hypothetical protein